MISVSELGTWRKHDYVVEREDLLRPLPPGYPGTREYRFLLAYAYAQADKGEKDD